MSSKAKIQKGVKPKLRFPEFRKAAQWEIRPLSKLADRVTARNKTNELNRVLTNSAVDGVVDQRTYFDKDIANQDNLDNYYIIEHGDYVYNPRISATAPVGPISKNKIEKGVMSPLYTIFRFKNECNDFYDHYFKSTYWHQYIQGAANTGVRFDRVAINNDQFMAMPLPVPHPKEQEKIANCFSSLDELIKAEAEMLGVLHQHKQGLMQELFPAEGKTLPNRRFHEFQDAPEWLEEKLADYIEEFREKSTIQDEYEVLTSARAGLIRQREYYDNNRITERDNAGFNIVPPNYITYRSRSDDGLFFFNLNDLGITGIISVYYPVFTITKGDNTFFTYLFSWFSEFIGKNSVGNAQKVLSLNELRKISLPIPSLEEQQKIARTLFSIEQRIKAQTQKLNTLRNHKKGLMQHLFSIGLEAQV